MSIRTKVLPGGRVEVLEPELPEGATVDVIVLVPPAVPGVRRPAEEILAEFPGQRLFKTAEEVDAYLREERESWDR